MSNNNNGKPGFSLGVHAQLGGELHATRDARFPTMGSGNITGWATATTAFRRPEVRGRNLAPCQLVHDLANCRTTYLDTGTPAHDARSVVIVARQEEDEGVADAIKSCEKAVAKVELVLSLNDRFNAAMAAGGRGVVREYDNAPEVEAARKLAALNAARRANARVEAGWKRHGRLA